MKKWICILLFTGFLSAASTDSKAEKDVLAAMDAWKQATMKKDGQAVMTVTSAVSKDGKTRTSTFKGKDPQGHDVNNVVVYDKQ